MKEQKIIVSRSDDSLVKDTREKEKSNLLSEEEMQEVHYEQYIMQEETIRLTHQLKRAVGTIFLQLLALVAVLLVMVFVFRSLFTKQTEAIEELKHDIANKTFTVVEVFQEQEKPIEEIIIEDPVEEPITEEQTEETTPLYYELSDDTKRDFAALVYLEAGSCSKECQLAIASVILNRMTTRNSTFEQIAYAPNQFSPADRIKSTTPSELSVECVEYVLENGPTVPEYVCFFRNCYYFDWVTPYMNVDNVYFSYDSRVKDRMCVV